MNQAFIDHYRCPKEFANFSLAGKLSEDSGFFRFGEEAICYGQSATGFRVCVAENSLHDTLQDVTICGSTIQLSFDPTQIIENLRRERYRTNSYSIEKGLVRDIYYLVRPFLPFALRRHLQRFYFRGWRTLSFPVWPVDTSVERILERLLVLQLRVQNVTRIPFIWFWPEGYEGCAILTHDIETARGLEFCPELMKINDSFGIKSSFQIIPEGRYEISDASLSEFRDRGFEVNIHDLNHDGNLFTDRKRFVRRAARINEYVKRYAALGFRSGASYRNLEWYDAFSFSYDMSVPNVAHLEPQRGGCCTIFPYFIGDLLELPLTTTQDYSLFHILGDYSTKLWKHQLTIILEKHGLASFLIHPDYIIEERTRNTYLALLDHLSRLRSEKRIWLALPRDVSTWWRQRSQMRLVHDGGAWRIEGAGKERARIACALLVEDQLSYVVK